MIEVGTVLENRYLVEKKVGEGGMGQVYLAVDQRFNSPVAIKQALFDDADLSRAFEREAHLLNNLRHPALPRVIDYFADDNGQFIVMEYIAGDDLFETLRQNGVFAVPEVLRWADDLLGALDYLHSQTPPVVHRDIKPQNLKMMPDGQIILLDFGLAKGNAGENSQISRTHSVFGYSRSYAPLEQIQGTGTDSRSDIYSLGATLYHLLGGKPPLDALSRATALVNGQPDALVPLNELNPQVPVEIAQILRQTLDLNASSRPQTAADLRESLREAAMSVEFDAESDPEATKVHAAKRIAVPLAAALVAGAPNDNQTKSIETSNAPENAENANAFAVTVEPKPFVGDEVYVVPEPENKRSNTFAKSAAIAAAILVLGGGAAAWYATSPPAVVNSDNQNQIGNTTAGKKPETNSAKSPDKNAVTNSPANSVTTETKTAANSGTKITSGKTATSSSSMNVEKSADEDEPAAEPTPIIVESAPPTNNRKKKDAEKINDDAEDTDENADSEEEAPKPSEKEKRRNKKRGNDNKEDSRERTAPDNRSSQQRPTLLGAPPNE